MRTPQLTCSLRSSSWLFLVSDVSRVAFRGVEMAACRQVQTSASSGAFFFPSSGKRREGRGGEGREGQGRGGKGYTGSGYITQYGIISEFFPGSDYLEGNMKTPERLGPRERWAGGGLRRPLLDRARAVDLNCPRFSV